MRRESVTTRAYKAHGTYSCPMWKCHVQINDDDDDDDFRSESVPSMQMDFGFVSIELKNLFFVKNGVMHYYSMAKGHQEPNYNRQLHKDSFVAIINVNVVNNCDFVTSLFITALFS